jgi:iron complex outermembrane receptor protein
VASRSFTAVYRRSASVVTLLLASATSAHAQEQAAPTTATDPAGAQEATSGDVAAQEGLSDIVVTARKRSELARDVPVSITAVSGDILQQRNVARLTDMVSVLPNFTLSLAANQPLTFIRGFGSGGSSVFEQAAQNLSTIFPSGETSTGAFPCSTWSAWKC